MKDLRVVAEPTEELLKNSYMKGDIIFGEYEIKNKKLFFNGDGVAPEQLLLTNSSRKKIKNFFYFYIFYLTISCLHNVKLNMKDM